MNAPATEKLAQLAKMLDRAATERKEVLMFADDENIDLKTAYSIQDLSILLRETRGDKPIGWKMGLTSRAKMAQMGVDSPICGVLTETMRLADHGKLKFAQFIHPKVEPEIAFHIGTDIPYDVSEEDVLKYVSRVCCGLEIIDSRFKDFKFTLKDVIADNCSSSAFVLSAETFAPNEADLANLGMVLEINGEPVQAGSSAAILDHPRSSLYECVQMLAKRGKKIRAGEIVLAGASTAAVLLKAGDHVHVRVQDLGSATFQVVK